MKLRIPLDNMVAFLARGIGPKQGLFLHRTAQHR